MTLTSIFITADNKRNVLHQHFKQQLQRVPRSENGSVAEDELRQLCDDNSPLDAVKMTLLWQKWCDVARLPQEPLHATAVAYVSLLDMDQQDTSHYNWGDMTDQAANNALNQAMPTAQTPVATSPAIEPSLWAKISFAPMKAAAPSLADANNSSHSHSSTSAGMVPPNLPSPTAQSSLQQRLSPAPHPMPSPTMLGLANESTHDRLVQDWRSSVLQGDAVNQGLVIKQDNMVQQITVSTENGSSVRLERQPRQANICVVIGDANHMDADAKMAVAAQMARVVCFSHMSMSEIATLTIDDMRIQASHPGFAAALTATMTEYITQMQRESSSHQATTVPYNEPSRRPRTCG